MTQPAKDSAGRVPWEVYQALAPYCRLINAQAAALPADAELHDECYLLPAVTALSKEQPNESGEGVLRGAVTLAQAWSWTKLSLAQFGLPAPSDLCECKMDAFIKADAECRDLSCVVGRAEDRMEAVLFDDFGTACRAFGGKYMADAAGGYCGIEGVSPDELFMACSQLGGRFDAASRVCVFPRPADENDGEAFDSLQSACKRFGGTWDAATTKCALPPGAANDLCAAQAFADPCDQDALLPDDDEVSN